MKWMLVVLAVGLAGCASYSELQKEEPEFSADTTKTPQEFTECVLPRWVDIMPGAHAMKDGDATVIVVPMDGTAGATAVTLTAKPTDKGSRVELRNGLIARASVAWRKASPCLR